MRERREWSQSWAQEKVAVYNLPLNSDQTGVPLHEHTAFMVVSGLLLDDLDDRQDALRGAVEIDALLAIWSVCTAQKRDRAKLTSLDAACRWLSQSMVATLSDPSKLLRDPLPPATRATWRRISVAAISVGRRARARCVDANILPRNAFWWGIVCGAKRELDDLNQLNGRSPLHGITWEWPPWIEELEQTISTTSKKGSVEHCVRQAIANRRTESPLVSGEEQKLWFRPYPEFRLLVPSLLQKLNRLKHLEEQFDETLQAEKLASLQQLAYGASHEINNPLANISTRAQTLVYNEVDSDRRKKLLAINDQAFRAYEMLADLMLFAKPPMLQATDVCLDNLLNDVRTELGDEAHRHGIRISLLLGDQQIQCKLDPVQITLAIKAICINGIEAMTDGGQLTVEATLDAERENAVVSVTDTGSGLDETARRHLFDPFYSGREAGRGLGFGLSKAWRIVDQHRGRITVDSQPSRGSRFRVILPLGGPDVVDKSANGKPQTSPNEPCPSNTSL